MLSCSDDKHAGLLNEWLAFLLLAFRALMLWGGNRKLLCFQTWRQWVTLKQGKKLSLRRALQHWQHLLLSQAFAAWQERVQRSKVVRAWRQTHAPCRSCCSPARVGCS